jgi:CelD/BcsL family acetyltransferase involved in cellulose biosynthesis
MAVQAVRAVQQMRTIAVIRAIQAIGFAEAPPRPLEDADALKSLELGWELLEARSASPMQHFIWAEAFSETYRDAGRLRVLAVGLPHTPDALAPLIQRRGLSGRLEALGGRELYEPMDLLYAEPQAACALAEALLREGRAVSLPRVPADSAVIGALQAAYRGRGVVRVVPAPNCPYIELDSSWTQPERRFNARRRSDFRRGLRHAERLGKVTFDVLVPNVLELPALLEEAWAVEVAGWKGVNGSAMACRTRLGSFFRRYAVAACRKGILRLCFMRIGGRAAAMQLATECGGRFWLHKIGYDEQFERCSPGTLLMLHTVRYAALRGLHSYEFLGSTAPWTQVWTRSERECVAVRAYPITARGIAAFSMDAASFCWRQLKSRL